MSKYSPIFLGLFLIQVLFPPRLVNIWDKLLINTAALTFNKFPLVYLGPCVMLFVARFLSKTSNVVLPKSSLQDFVVCKSLFIKHQVYVC